MEDFVYSDWLRDEKNSIKKNFQSLKKLPFKDKKTLLVALFLLISMPAWVIIASKAIVSRFSQAQIPATPPTAPITITPTIIPNTGNPINWTTRDGYIRADKFYAVAGNRVFVAPQSATYRISGNPPYNGNYMTIEVNWTENNQEMRFFIYFRHDGNRWYSYEFRTYGQPPDPYGDWLFYTNGSPYFITPLGQEFTASSLRLFSNPSTPDYPYTGYVYFENLRMQAFTNPLTVTPTSFTPSPTRPVITPTSFTPSPTQTPTSTPSPLPVLSTSLSPTDDSFVNSNNPSTTYGSERELKVELSPTKLTYMKFNLNRLLGKEIVSASLRIKPTDASINTQSVRYTTGYNWSESTLNYNNRPALGSIITNISNFSVVNRTYEIDLTNAVRNRLSASGTYRGILSLAISTGQTDRLFFYSKEALTSANRPQLVIRYR